MIMGSIILDRIDGMPKISCDYGSLRNWEITAEHELNFDYTSNFYHWIQFNSGNNLSRDYSGFTIL